MYIIRILELEDRLTCVVKNKQNQIFVLVVQNGEVAYKQKFLNVTEAINVYNELKFHKRKTIAIAC